MSSCVSAVLHSLACDKHLSPRQWTHSLHNITLSMSIVDKSGCLTLPKQCFVAKNLTCECTWLIHMYTFPRNKEHQCSPVSNRICEQELKCRNLIQQYRKGSPKYTPWSRKIPVSVSIPLTTGSNC